MDKIYADEEERELLARISDQEEEWENVTLEIMNIINNIE